MKLIRITGRDPSLVKVFGEDFFQVQAVLVVVVASSSVFSQRFLRYTVQVQNDRTRTFFIKMDSALPCISPLS